MLNVRRWVLLSAWALAAWLPVSRSIAQDLQPHRAAYDVSLLEHGKPSSEVQGTYAYELKLTCDGYIINQRLRLELEGSKGSFVSEQQSQMTESRDGRKLSFEHQSGANGRQVSLVRGEAILDSDGRGEARFSDPEGRKVALPAGTMFPTALTLATLKHAAAKDGGFDALFFFGEKPKPPQSVNVVIGRVPKRLANLKVPDEGLSIVEGRSRIYFRAGFFDADAKKEGDQAAFEMSSLTLDNGVELYGTHEEGESGFQYRISRLEPLAKPNCN